MSQTLALEPIEKASIDELRALQLKRLQATLHHAYRNSPVYRRKFDQAGVHPDDCRTLADLARFPMTTKADLRDHYPFGMFAVPRDQVRRVHASSGTTGKPTVVGYTRQDIEHWAQLVARSMRAAGTRPGDLVHVAYGYGLFTGGLGAHYGAEKLGCTVIPMSGGQTEKQLQLIQDFKPRVIMVTPSYMQVLIEEFTRNGLDARESSLEIGIFGAEPWTEAMRADIESGAVHSARAPTPGLLRQTDLSERYVRRITSDVRLARPMKIAIGMVAATVNVPQGLSASALTTINASTASRIVMIMNVPNSAITPGTNPNSDLIKSPSDRPSRRVEINRIMKS